MIYSMNEFGDDGLSSCQRESQQGYIDAGPGRNCSPWGELNLNLVFGLIAASKSNQLNGLSLIRLGVLQPEFLACSRLQRCFVLIAA
jgi:hypothetical protein